MKVDEIARLSGLLVSNLKFKLDYCMYLNKKRKLIIVEGKTDQVFVEFIKEDYVDCIGAANVFNSNNQLRSRPSEPINYKNAIVTIIRGITHIPSPFIKYASDLDKWDLYGLVDSDFDDIAFAKPTPRLFVTDTHDLETLLLSTDSDLLFKIDGCSIQHGDISNAFFVAYQLALIRKEIENYKNHLNLQSVKSGSSVIDFSSFVEDCKISVPDLIKYIGNNTPDGVSKSRVQSIVTSVCSCKSLKNKLDNTGRWNQSVQDYLTSLPADFWRVVNGHDILQLLTYYSEDAARSFGESNGYSLNRSFELSLIKAYDYKHFKNTNLFEKMNMEGLIKSF